MNAVFSVIFILSAAVLLVMDPAEFLPALLDGAGKSATLCLALLASYAAWLGLMQLWEESGVTRGISRLLTPLCRKLFRTEDKEALSAIGMNLSANLLGIGAPPPLTVSKPQICWKKEKRTLFLLHALRRQRHFPANYSHLRGRHARRGRQRFRRRHHSPHRARHRLFHPARDWPHHALYPSPQNCPKTGPVPFRSPRTSGAEQ